MPSVILLWGKSWGEYAEPTGLSPGAVFRQVILRVLFIKFIADGFAKAAGLVVFPIMARKLGADGYGAYIQIVTIANFLAPWATLGISGALVRFFSGLVWTSAVHRYFLKIFLFATASAAVVSLILLLGAPWMNEWFLGWPDRGNLFRLGAAFVFLNALQAFILDLLRAREQLVTHCLFQILGTLVLVGSAYIALPAGLDIHGFMALVLILKGLLLLFELAVILRQPVTYDLHAEVQLAPLGKLVRFGIPIAVLGWGIWLMNTGDRLVIGRFMTPADLGVYGAIYSLCSLVIAFNAPFLLPLYPRMARGVNTGDDEYLEYTIRTFHKYMALVLVPVVTGLTLFGPELLVLLGGDEFKSGWLLFFLVTLPFSIGQWNAAAHYLLTCRDDVFFARNVWLVAGAGNVAFNIAAVPALGLFGAALVTLVSYLVLDLIIFRRASRYLNLFSLYQWRTTLLALLSCFPGVLFSRWALGQGYEAAVALTLSILVFLLLYLLMLLVLRQLGSREFLALRQAFGAGKRNSKA